MKHFLKRHDQLREKFLSPLTSRTAHVLKNNVINRNARRSIRSCKWRIVIRTQIFDIQCLRIVFQKHINKFRPLGQTLIKNVSLMHVFWNHYFLLVLNLKPYHPPLDKIGTERERSSNCLSDFSMVTGWGQEVMSNECIILFTPLKVLLNDTLRRR